MMMMNTVVIAIDGPSGSGKGTLAAKLAVHYGYHLLDSGALYRLLGLATEQAGHFAHMPLDTHAIAELARHLDIEFIPDDQQCLTIRLNGQDVTDTIRTETVGTLASKVAVIPEVREALLCRQRDFAQTPGLIADGRDMGTVVFTDAPVKIYLTASAEARATRRVRQLQGMGISASMDDILSDLVARDRRDMERTIAPLKPADDAYQIDSSDLGIDDVLALMIAYTDQQLAADISSVSV
jgi:CMP/dCMP kinase